MSTKFVAVAGANELTDGKQKLVRVGDRAILVCRSDGQYFAVENRCTHDNEQLSGGAIQKCTIVCPMHGARFNLKNGAPIAGLAFEPLTTFPVRVEGENVEVGVPA